MRGLKRNPWLFGLGGLLAILVVYGGHARADVTTDQSGSIVIFPKVIADGSRDTLIELTNTSNMSAQAHCFYINTAGSCSVTTTESCRLDTDCPETEVCVRTCQEQDFDLFLTAQQPTMWRVSTGRLVDFTVPPCRVGQPCRCTSDASHATPGSTRCPGIDPGVGGQNSFAVLPMGTDFEGELKCVQTDDSFAAPTAQNSLKGEAIIETISSGQISEYNALSVLGNPSTSNGVNSNLDLLLNWTGVTGAAGEYNFCPQNLVLNHYAAGAVDTFSGATVNTELTLVPCTELLEQQLPTHARALFSIVNEFESPLSASITFDCYLNSQLAAISGQLTVGNIGSTFAKTRITPPGGSICYSGSQRCHLCTANDPDGNCAGQPVGVQVGNCSCSVNGDCPGFVTSDGGTPLGCRPWSGLLGVAEEFHSLSGHPDGTAAVNLHVEGNRATLGGDVMVISPPPL